MAKKDDNNWVETYLPGAVLFVLCLTGMHALMEWLSATLGVEIMLLALFLWVPLAMVYCGIMVIVTLLQILSGGR